MTTVSRKPRIAVVDPYSSGYEMAPAFAARGIGAIAIRTAFSLPEMARDSWAPSHFDVILDGTQPEAELVSRLRELGPLRILAGNESGVELAEALTARLLPHTGNVPELTAARRDKWQTALALSRAGIPCIRQICTADPDAVRAWLAEAASDGPQPLVLKPPKSAGTDNVHIVRAGDDWQPVFARILGTTNMMGLRNDGVLVQEYARGTEYAVDTYSADGVHGLLSVCRYRKRALEDRLGIYEAVDFLPPDAPRVAEVYAYVRRVLDAVGLRNGSAHVEVMDTARGPRLIEVNARISGGHQQRLTRLATGDCQIDRSVRHVLGEPLGGGYRLLHHVTVAYLSASRHGIWRNAEDLRNLARLPTFHDIHLAYGTGDHVPRTVDVFTSIGQVVLAGKDANAVDTDYDAVRAYEARMRIDAAA
ncbi:ATP-grasp domain-containing protein [Pendulispora albinea]|uniref:ATP-grasp domain-containing protein n=1 Tax=Pendulispora albinea TaxID=2741071 RepID=A0ABZ2LYW1_9BACT